MNDSVKKILFLRVPEADDSLGQKIVDGMVGHNISHEFIDVMPGGYDDILDRLTSDVLPVVLKAAH